MSFDREAMAAALCLYAVTDRSWKPDMPLYRQVELALKGGVTMVQLREKNLSKKEFLEEAYRLKKLCRIYQVPLIINDDVEIALESDADGVHVGQEDMAAQRARCLLGPDKILGVSVHSVEEAREAEAAGADYLGVGAAFGSATKKDAKPIDRRTMRAICQAISIPVVAIGGITKGNLKQLAGTGVKGVALISAIFAAENIAEECSELLNLSRQMTGSR